MFLSTCIIYLPHLHSWEGALTLLMANSQVQKQPTTSETAFPTTHHCYPEAARMESGINFCCTTVIVKTDLFLIIPWMFQTEDLYFDSQF